MLRLSIHTHKMALCVFLLKSIVHGVHYWYNKDRICQKEGDLQYEKNTTSAGNNRDMFGRLHI